MKPIRALLAVSVRLIRAGCGAVDIARAELTLEPLADGLRLPLHALWGMPAAMRGAQSLHETVGGVHAAVGYLQSPGSWWNDLFVNIPIAYAFGALFGLVSEELFLPAMVAGYWITNILGLVLMHRGAKTILSKKSRTRYSRRDLLADMAVSVVYTIIVVVLAAVGVLRLPAEYFQ